MLNPRTSFLFLTIKTHSVSFVFVDQYHNSTTGSEPTPSGTVKEASDAVRTITRRYQPHNLEMIFDVP